MSETKKPAKPSELLTDESTWFQGGPAVTADGTIVGHNNPDAVRWCIWGACKLVYGNEYFLHYQKLCDAIKDTINTNDVIGWQDKPGRTFSEVRELLLEAGE